MDYRTLVFGILCIIYIFLFLNLYSKEKSKIKNSITTKQIVRVGIFGALSSILYIFIKFPVPFFPSFLEFHFDEVPAFIASFAYGPISGILVLLVKTLIKLPFSHTLGVGELSDFVFSAAFIVPAAIIYKRRRNFLSVIIGLSLGVVIQLSISLVENVYFITPFYINMMGFSEDYLISSCQLANPNIIDLKWTYGFIAILPFNIIKDAVVIFLTIISYKSTHRFIDKLEA